MRLGGCRSRRLGCKRQGRSLTKLLFVFAVTFFGCLGSAESTGTSFISFCITDGASSQLFYLTDLTSPLPGQSVSEEQYSQGRLILGGSFLPNPKIIVTSADKKHSSEVEVDWSRSSHRRATEYYSVLGKICQDIRMDSSAYLSVVPIGLAGSTGNEKKPSAVVLVDSASDDPTGFFSFLSARQSVPRLWPMISAYLHDSHGVPPVEDVTDESKRVSISSVARFVVSLLRFKVEVTEEEDHYISSLTLQKQRRRAKDPHPDLREGQLRADLPHAYVSHIDYGHKLVISVNITVTVGKRRAPPYIDQISHNLMRVVARDLSASVFDDMYPGVDMFVRFRWDPDVPPPEDAIRFMRDRFMKRYDDEPPVFNATAMTCPLGSFRRSKHMPALQQLPMCPSVDEFPSLSDPSSSWVMQGGGAKMLQSRVEEWRIAMQSSPEVASQAVPLSLMVRRSPSGADVAIIEELMERENVTSNSSANTSIPTGRPKAHVQARARLKERSILSYSSTTCMQSSTVPLPLMLALGDLLVFLSLTVLVVFCGWLYLLSGYFVARLSEHVRLPPFISVHSVPFRLHLLTFGGGVGSLGE